MRTYSKIFVIMGFMIFIFVNTVMACPDPPEFDCEGDDNNCSSGLHCCSDGHCKSCCDDDDCIGCKDCISGVCYNNSNNCPSGQYCCAGSCKECCYNSHCPGEFCCNNECEECCDGYDAQCGSGNVCCDNECKTGNCCGDGDCSSGNICCENNCYDWDSRAKPTNMQMTYVSDQLPGFLYFKYSWESTSGNMVDLLDCKVSEYVDYPGDDDPYIWPRPPWAHDTPNPTAPPDMSEINGYEGVLVDTHLPGKATNPPYQEASFTAQQKYIWYCEPCMGDDDDPDNWETLLNIGSIVRTISGPPWECIVEKSGYTSDPLDVEDMVVGE